MLLQETILGISSLNCLHADTWAPVKIRMEVSTNYAGGGNRSYKDHRTRILNQSIFGQSKRLRWTRQSLPKR